MSLKKEDKKEYGFDLSHVSPIFNSYHLNDCKENENE